MVRAYDPDSDDMLIDTSCFAIPDGDDIVNRHTNEIGVTYLNSSAVRVVDEVS